MNYPKPEYSLSKINWAGEVVASEKPTSDDLLKAREIINNWRAAHNYPLNTFNVTLRVRVEKIDSRAIVAQRLKRFPTIIEKLQRFPTMRLSRMQDLGGLRAIVTRVLSSKSRDDAIFVAVTVCKENIPNTWTRERR